ncbi:lysozyme inhibitor LprI family protein [Paraflavisolibacter sp. H34]
MEKNIRQDIEKEIVVLKQQMKNSQATDLHIEFATDTIRIERYMEKYMDYDYSTAGMRAATYDAAAQYDSLLNKYYKKLLLVLKPEDKKVLQQAQRAWLSYRDNELKLVAVVRKDAYSGGGTLQQLTDTGYYLDIIKSRTIELYHHLSRATQDQ